MKKVWLVVKKFWLVLLTVVVIAWAIVTNWFRQDPEHEMEAGTGQDIAVYMVGAEPADILSGDFRYGVKGRTGMELARTIRSSSDYSAANHTRKILAFAGKERKEREKQRIDDVTDEQVKQFGEHVGAKYLCIAEIINTGDSAYSLEARLVNAATAEIIKNVSVPLELIRKTSSEKWRYNFKNVSELEHAAQHAARELVGGNNEIVNYTMKEISDNPDKAIVGLTDAIRLEPNVVKHYKYRGDAYRHIRDYACAVADYTEVIRLEPDSAKHRYDRGELYLDIYSGKNIDSVIADYTDAIRLAPDKAGYRAARANAYSRKDDLDSAIADYTDAIRLAPDTTSFLAARAKLYSSKNDHDSAIADYAEIIRIEPTPWHFALIGGAYLNKKDHDSAIADYTEAIKLDTSNDARYYAYRGDAYLDRKDLDSAIADYTEAIQLSGNGVYYAKRGDVYLDRKDFDMAIADYTEAIRLGSSYSSRRDERLNIEYSKGYYHAKRGDTYLATENYYDAFADYNIALGRSDRYDYSGLDKNVKLQTQKNMKLASKKVSFFSHVRYWLYKNDKSNFKVVVGILIIILIYIGVILIWNGLKLIWRGLKLIRKWLGRIRSRPRS
jgi:tetratricopeptide (TPR) repeat protein